MLMLRYRGVCHHARPVVFQQTQVPKSLLMGANYVDYNPKELKWSKSTYKLPPKRVAAMVDYHTRITHQVLLVIQTINQNHLSWTPFIHKTHSQLNMRKKIKHNTKPWTIVYKFSWLSFSHNVSFLRKDELLQMFILSIYSHLVSSTT